MAKSFAEMRKGSGAGFGNLMKEVEKLASGGAGEKRGDDRFWKPTVDKAGNGYAVLRFLPAPEGEEYPWVRMWDHGFQGPTGKWYIENSLTTLGNTDPVSELNSELWNSGIESNKEIARKQKRRLKYIVNVLVVSDPGNPENNGKVFLYSFGKKIFDKIKDLMQPQFADEEAVNPFDFWTGANFKLKIRKVEGYQNYDKSEFDKPTPVAKDDAKIEAIWKQQHSLQDFLDPKNFKAYEDLKKRLEFVLGKDAKVQSREVRERMEDEPVAEAPRARAAAAAAPKAEVEDEEEDTMAYFNKLASEED